MNFEKPILVRFNYAGKKEIRGALVSLDGTSLSIVDGAGCLVRIDLVSVGSEAGLGPVWVDDKNTTPLGLCLPCWYNDAVNFTNRSGILVADFAGGPVVVDLETLRFELSDGVVVFPPAVSVLFGEQPSSPAGYSNKAAETEEALLEDSESRTNFDRFQTL